MIVLNKSLNKCQTELIDSTIKIYNERQNLESEIKEFDQFKTQINEDFSRIKKGMIASENAITVKIAEKEDIQKKFNELRNNYISKDKDCQDITEEYDRFLWDMLFSLETAKAKYDSNELTKSLPGMDSPLLSKISSELENPEQEKSLDRSDKKTGIIKYIGIINEIANTFCFKYHEILQNYANFEKTRLECQNLQNLIEEQRVKFEAERNQILEAKEDEYNIKNQEISDLTNDFQKQILLIKSDRDHLKELVYEKDKKFKEISAELAIAANTNLKHADTFEGVKGLCNSLVVRLNDLIFQKNLLSKQYDSTKNHSNKLENFLKRVYCKFREYNLGIKNDETVELFNDGSEGIYDGYSALSKFRKCALAVIALNRMRYLVKSKYEGFGKYEIEDFESIEHENLDNLIHANPRYEIVDSCQSLQKIQNTIEPSISITPVKRIMNEEFKEISLDNILMNANAISNSKPIRSRRNKRSRFAYIGGTNRHDTRKLYKSHDPISPFYTALTRQLDLQIKTYFDKVKQTEFENVQ